MSLADVTKVTKIQARTLEHLEAGRFDQLPADVFVRGFVRSYARCVGLDPDEAVRRYSECGKLPGPVATAATTTAAALLESMADLAPTTVHVIRESGEMPAVVPPVVEAIEPAPVIEVVEVVEPAPVVAVAVEAPVADAPKPKRKRRAPAASNGAPKKSRSRKRLADGSKPPFTAEGSGEIAVEIAPSAEAVLGEGSERTGSATVTASADRDPLPQTDAVTVTVTVPDPDAATDPATAAVADAATAAVAATDTVTATDTVAVAVAATDPVAATDSAAATATESAAATATDSATATDAEPATPPPAVAPIRFIRVRPPVQPPRLVIDDANPEQAAFEQDARSDDEPRKSVLPPNLIDNLLDGERPRQGGLTLAVIILLIAATLTLSYLMRRPSSGGEGVTGLPPPPASIG